jgi:primase-polymerase (primpol)-like protein
MTTTIHTSILSAGTPAVLRPQFETIPGDIRRLPQWVCWQYNAAPAGNGTRWAKLPITPLSHQPAKANDPSTWASYESAVRSYQQGNHHGVGFVFTPEDPYVGIDLDDCRQPSSGTIAPWALDYIRHLNTYTEVSPSGTGVKCILEGSLPPGRRRTKSIEFYDTSRYFTITGRVINGFRDISVRPVELRYLYRSICGATSAPEHIPAYTPPTDLQVDDHEILRRATTARNGAKFHRLWNGILIDAQGDHSGADLALCRLLAFWCGPRPELVARLFRQSKLYRQKWDDVHFADGRTYGEATIDIAIRSQNGVFYRWLPPTPRSRPSLSPNPPHGWFQPKPLRIR